MRRSKNQNASLRLTSAAPADVQPSDDGTLSSRAAFDRPAARRAGRPCCRVPQPPLRQVACAPAQVGHTIDLVLRLRLVLTRDHIISLSINRGDLTGPSHPDSTVWGAP